MTSPTNGSCRMTITVLTSTNKNKARKLSKHINTAVKHSRVWFKGSLGNIIKESSTVQELETQEKTH